MIVDSITELSIVTVLDRGIPNQECIAIKANAHVEMGQYGLMLGIYKNSGMATPVHDSLFWFGDGQVSPGDWIFLNTCAGEASIGKTTDQLNNNYSLFWNKPKTLFANSNIVPILFRIDAVEVLDPPVDAPQAKKLTST
jgi:hypothetical protein